MKLITVKADFCYGYPNVELAVEIEDCSLVYIHCSYADGMLYTVGKTSVYDIMVGNKDGEDIEPVEYLELYEKISQAKESVYYPFIKESNRIYKALGSGLIK